MDNNELEILQFYNCKILRDHVIVVDDLWVRQGKIVDPEKIFFDEKKQASHKINCQGALISPGFIDIQINGGFGVDFSHDVDTVDKGLNVVAKGILAHGVTSFCPTLVSSPQHVYRKVLPKLPKRAGGMDGASVLGAHVEGPFISVEKKGAHNQKNIMSFEQGYASVLDMYGSLDNICIVTLAPEKMNALNVIRQLVDQGITVSLGHSMSDIKVGESAVSMGASLITHLFNAMLPFHHRDPGLVGLLASANPKPVYFGIIADGVHTHLAALRIAYRTHPAGVILVTDAISAMGLSEGTHHIGQSAIDIKGSHAYIAGTDTLCGSIANMNTCVQVFRQASGCSLEHALECASLHPALALGISERKGTLGYGADADLVMFAPDTLQIWSTWIAGQCVYQADGMPQPLHS